MKEAVFLIKSKCVVWLIPAYSTLAFRLLEDNFKGAIQESSTYICDICWKFNFQRNDSTSNHIFGRAIWEKLPVCIFKNSEGFKNHEGDLS